MIQKQKFSTSLKTFWPIFKPRPYLLHINYSYISRDNIFVGWTKRSSRQLHSKLSRNATKAANSTKLHWEHWEHNFFFENKNAIFRSINEAFHMEWPLIARTVIKKTLSNSSRKKRRFLSKRLLQKNKTMSLDNQGQDLMNSDNISLRSPDTGPNQLIWPKQGLNQPSWPSQQRWP